MTTDDADVKVTLTASTDDFSRVISESGPEFLGLPPGATVVPLDRNVED